MTLSVNEISALAAKAARGAGAPPQQAAEFGRAVVCHLQANRAPQDLRAVLSALPKGPVIDLPLALVRMCESVQGDHGQAVMGIVGSEGLTQSYLDALPFAVTYLRVADGFDIRLTFTEPATRPAAPRVTLPSDLAADMETLAAKILVPDTAASRASGAGAGLTDND